jgi:hypothetical protein
MINLVGTSDIIRVITSSTANIAVHASWMDLSGTTVTPGRTNTAISIATTTTIVAAPAGSTQRNVKTLTISNTHASTVNTVTVQYYDGATAYQIFKRDLAAGEMIVYDEDGGGFSVRDSVGRILTRTDNLVSAAVSSLNTVVLSADQTNNNGTANTMEDVTGLSFAVTAGETYWFRFVIAYTAAATTTGSRWAISGPGSPTLLNYTSTYTLTATSNTVNSATAYDIPAASNATSLTAGNIAIIEGIITPSANGTVIARHASEVLSSAIVAKAGSMLQWIRTL